MRNLKKKLLAGLLCGAMIFTGAQTFAAPTDDADRADREAKWQQEAAERIGGWSKYFAERYGLNSAEIEKAFADGVHIEDIKNAALLAKLSGKSFSDVLAMKVDWPQVAQKLGVTREQIKNFYANERDEAFAKKSGLDVSAYKSLVKDGYRPHDIDIAARIAKASGKDIKTVLGSRKINNTWSDVAKSFGVDIKTIMPKPHGHGDAPRDDRPE